MRGVPRSTFQEFLSYYPLKQGLKHMKKILFSERGGYIFILLSIKTRIETEVLHAYQA